jgi:hypothetical protein
MVMIGRLFPRVTNTVRITGDGVYGSPLSRGRQRSVCRRLAKISRFEFQTAKRSRLAPPREFKLLVLSPRLEGRRSAERRALVVTKAPFGRSVAATSSSLGPDFRAQARASSPSRQVSPPFTCLVQPLKAAPRSGHGRLPKAPRVHACEAQPRAPHRPSGCPSGQLSLCPTSVTPLEAPLTGQDTRRISEVLETGIGIHSQCRERRFFCSPDGAKRNPGQSRREDGIPDFASLHPGYER